MYDFIRSAAMFDKKEDVLAAYQNILDTNRIFKVKNRMSGQCRDIFV